MKKNTNNTGTKTGAFTTVNTMYARVAMILLAVNLCLTGYALVRLTDASEAPPESGAQQSPSSEQQTPPTVGVADEPRSEEEGE